MLTINIDNSFDDQLDFNDIDAIMKRALKTNRKEIMKYFDSKYDIDSTTYEFGIDDWFGLSSVMLYELGADIGVRVGQSLLQLIIE